MARIYLSPPHMSGEELALLQDAFASNWIAPLGPHVDSFERELAASVGVSHACALSSGTAGLHLSLLMLGVSAGDDVITSTLTFSATANAITYLGAKPVFVDADRISWNMDPGLLEEALASRAKKGRLPKAVVVVDLYGQCADFDAIRGACDRYEIPIVEDAAEALGASYKGRPAGSLAAMGVFSFNGNKIITTSGGGMLVSDRKEWIEQARFLSTQARDPAPYYQHSRIGYNYRMSNLLAAVGRGQLRVLETRVAARRATFQAYQEALASLPGISFMPEPAYGRSTRWLTCIQVNAEEFGATAEGIRQHLELLDIESRPVWKPMHLQPVFRGCEVIGGAVATDLFEHGLCLPSGSSLTEGEREKVITALQSTCWQKRALGRY